VALPASISLFLAFYEAADEASKTLHALRALDKSGDVRLLAAAIFSRNGAAEKLRIVNSFELPGEEGGPTSEPRGLIDIIFPPAILELVPVGPATTTADEHFSELGFSQNVLKELGENMVPGGSAIAVLVDDTWVQRFAGAQASLERFAIDPQAGGRLWARAGRKAG